MQVQILSGIVRAAQSPDLRRERPLNLMPVIEPGGTGISNGYLKTPPGVRTVTSLAKLERGGTLWEGRHLRVVGDRLVKVSVTGVLTDIGEIADDGRPVTFTQGFGRLAIAGGNQLYYYDGNTLTRVTDPDLGQARSVTWQDGYYVTTDGTSLVATDLKDPTSIDPLRYGSSEADPDPVVAVHAMRGELYALNRYSIEVFVNAGASAGVFPFQRQRGAEVSKGCVGAKAWCPFQDTIAFVGGGRGEPPSVHLMGQGQAAEIAPGGLQRALAELTASQLGRIEVEQRTIDGAAELLVHLPGVTWVYAFTASRALETLVWYQSTSPQRHPVLSGTDAWWGGPSLGVTDETIASVYGQALPYRFTTPLIYNGGLGAIMHALELVTLGGNAAIGVEPTASLAYTDDGVTWSGERHAALGRTGQRNLRACWRRIGRMRHWRGLRFSGVATAPIGFARLEATLEGLGG